MGAAYTIHQIWSYVVSIDRSRRAESKNFFSNFSNHGYPRYGPYSDPAPNQGWIFLNLNEYGHMGHQSIGLDELSSNMPLLLVSDDLFVRYYQKTHPMYFNGDILIFTPFLFLHHKFLFISGNFHIWHCERLKPSRVCSFQCYVAAYIIKVQSKVTFLSV